MPLYEYQCARHGAFELVRPMSESKLGAPCPRCAKVAPRILSAPNLAAVPRAARIAKDRNERSRHEPKIVSGNQAATPHRPAFRASHGRPWALEHG